MRKFALAFLTLIMLTPSLACAMPVCKGETAAEQPCHPTSHETSNKGETETNDLTTAMLLQDCLGIDLIVQSTDNSDLQPDQSVDTLDFAWADLTANYNFEPKNINAIRGPPPTVDTTSPSRPLYLTTQRFRI